MTTAEPDYHNDACYRCIQGGTLLCCSYCTLAFHMECLSPPLKSVPSGLWRCPVCSAERSSLRPCPTSRKHRHQRLPQGLRARFVLQGVRHPPLELAETQSVELRRKWSCATALSPITGASSNPTHGKPHAKERPALGARVELYWKLDDAWYPGTVCDYKGSPPDDLAQIEYDDGATESICLGEEPWRYEGKKMSDLLTAETLEPPRAPAPAPTAKPVSEGRRTKAMALSAQGMRRGTSKYLGVCRPNKADHWMAQISVNGVKHMLGNFKCEVEAARAYDAAAYRFRGPSATLNFPDDVQEQETEEVEIGARAKTEAVQQQPLEPHDRQMCKSASAPPISCTAARSHTDEGRRKSRKPWYLSDYQHSFEDASCHQHVRAGSAKIQRDVLKTQGAATLATPHVGKKSAKLSKPQHDPRFLSSSADVEQQQQQQVSPHVNATSSEVQGAGDSRKSDVRVAALPNPAQPQVVLHEQLATVDIVHAKDDQSPTEIATLYKVPLDEVMQLNRHRFGGFTKTCKLMEGTPILIPSAGGTQTQSDYCESQRMGQQSEHHHKQLLHLKHQRQVNNSLDDHKEKQKSRARHAQEHMQKHMQSNLPSPRRNAGSSSDWLTTLLLRESEFTTGDSHGLREGQRVGVARSTGRGFSKTGTVTRWSVKCDCCKHVFSLAGFERHGNCEKRSPYNTVHAITTQLNNRSQPLCVSAWPIVSKEEVDHLQRQAPIYPGTGAVRAAQLVRVPARGGENFSGTVTGQASQCRQLLDCIGCQRGWNHLCRSLNSLRSVPTVPKTPARPNIKSAVSEMKSPTVTSEQASSGTGEGCCCPNMPASQHVSQAVNQYKSDTLLPLRTTTHIGDSSGTMLLDAKSAIEHKYVTLGRCSSTHKQADDAAVVQQMLNDIVTEIERDMVASAGSAPAKRKASILPLPERSGRKRKISSRFANYTTDLQGDSATVATADTRPAKDEKSGNHALYIVLGGMLEELMCMDCFGLFAEPVNKREVPDYARLIRRPMDYSTMRKKLERRVYSSVAQFGHDAMLICKNAMTFNSEGDVHYAAADNLMQFTKCMVEHVMQHERNSFAGVELPTLMKGFRADRTNALYMRTRENEDALYMQAAIRRTSVVAQQAVLVPLVKDNKQVQRRSVVSLKVHERFLLDALHAAAEDKRSRVFQETDAGCARCETYAQHLRYKQMRRAKSATGGVRSAHVRAKNASSTSVGDNGGTEAPMTEDQLKMLPRVDIQHLMLRGSDIQGWGLFTKVRIEAENVVIEYYGEYLRNKIADLKQEQYERRRMADYMFRVGDDMVLDATYRGGRARFINHSCDPNCYAKIISCADGKNRIFIISKRAIDISAEITYDYQFEPEEVKIPCLCGAPNCRGTLN